MKVDVIIIGSGIAGLAIAAALGRQKLKAIVIAPDIPSSNFDFEYIFDEKTITDLPAFDSFETIRFSGDERGTLNRTLLRVDSQALYKRFMFSCADNGVGMMHGSAVEVVSYRKFHRVDWVPNALDEVQLPKEELFAPVVIDASGGSTIFSPKPDRYASTLRRVFKGDGNFFENEFCYFDSPDSLLNRDDQLIFRRGFRDSNGQCFVDISCRDYFEPDCEELKDRLIGSFESAEFNIDGQIETAYFHTPIFSKDVSSKILAFGDAASMAHPFTGEATSSVINKAPRLAKAIAESLDKSPTEIVEIGRKSLFSDTELYLKNALGFIDGHLITPAGHQRDYFMYLLDHEKDFDTILMGKAPMEEIYVALMGIVKILGSNEGYEQFCKRFQPN